jgi:hypothetical protein
MAADTLCDSDSESDSDSDSNKNVDIKFSAHYAFQE